MTAIYKIPAGYTIDDLNALRPVKGLAEVRADGTTLNGVAVQVAEAGDYLVEYSVGVQLDKGSNKSANLVRCALYAGGLQVALDQTPLSIGEAYSNYELGGSQVISLPASSHVELQIGKGVKQGGTHRVHGGIIKITKL